MMGHKVRIGIECLVCTEGVGVCSIHSQTGL